MMSELDLFKIAAQELMRVFGKKYLQENFKNTCKAYGKVNDSLYQFFAGFKTQEDLPNREANNHGWVVYALFYLNPQNGAIIKREYNLE